LGGSTVTSLLTTVPIHAAARHTAAAAETFAQAGPPATPTGTLRVAIPGEPNFIDPSKALEITEWSICRNVYDGLVEWDANYENLVPGLAESWQSNADATQWTFKLRSGVTFHDGAAFDSHAARKTIEYYKDKTWGLIWANIDKIDDSDPAVLALTFTAPSPDLLRNQTIARMISPNLIAQDAVGTKAVGTGPFTFVTWQKGTGVTLAANPDYWRKPDGPHLAQIQLLAINDNTAAITALTAGDLDLVMKVPPRQLQTLSIDPRFAVSAKDSWIEGHIIVRTDQPPVNDVRVRQALMYAIDRDALVNDVLLGQAAVAASPMPKGTYGHVEPPTSYMYDKAKARALLTDAGYTTGPDLKMSAAALIRVMGEEVSQAIVGQLQDAGINVTLDIQEAGVFVADATADTPMHHLFHSEYGWANGGPFHLTIGTALGHAKYTGAELTDLVKTVSTTPDGDQRLQVLAKTQDLFMQELPHTPLYHLKLSDVYRAELMQYSNPRDGYLPYFGRAYLASSG
jgi:peptide/nickel transport system substrate-binding protein